MNKTFNNKERQVRTFKFKNYGDEVGLRRMKCSNCGGHQVMKYYVGPIELYCYKCSWKSLRDGSQKETQQTVNLPPVYRTKPVNNEDGWYDRFNAQK